MCTKQDMYEYLIKVAKQAEEICRYRRDAGNTVYHCV